MTEKIMGGYFIIARQLFDSKIWVDKPSSWKIIWIYIFGNVCHKKQGGYERGEGFFMFTKEIKSIGADITIDMVKKCLSFLRKSEMISTSRSTRGVRIKVLKFDKYQDQKNYTGTSRSTKKALRKHEESTPIYNKEKKEKNTRQSTIASDSKKLLDYFFERYFKLSGKKPVMTTWAKYNKNAQRYIKTFGLEEMKNKVEKYFKSTDKFFSDNNYPIDIFLTDNVINKLD